MTKREAEILRVLEGLRDVHVGRLKDAAGAHWSYRKELDNQRVGVEQALFVVKRLLEGK